MKSTKGQAFKPMISPSDSQSEWQIMSYPTSH